MKEWAGMPPPNNPLASHMAEVMWKAHNKRHVSGATMDNYPSSHSDLVWCAIALIEAGLVPQWDDFQEVANGLLNRDTDQKREG